MRTAVVVVAATAVVCALLWARMWTRSQMVVGDWALRGSRSALQFVHNGTAVAQFEKDAGPVPCVPSGRVTAPNFHSTLVRSGALCTSDKNGYLIQRQLTQDAGAAFANTDFFLGQGLWRKADAFDSSVMGSPTGCGRPNAPLAASLSLEQSFAGKPCGLSTPTGAACPAPTPALMS